MISITQQMPGLLQRNSVLLPRMLSYVLVILIAISSAKLIWSLFTSENASNSVPAVQTKSPKLVKPPPPKPDYGAQIARLHIMGKASIAEAINEDAPDTSLNLGLSGVLALGGGEGFAIILNERKKHKFYQIDDEITSGVTLHSVYSDYVLISRSGRTEKLSLPKATLNGLNAINNTTNSPVKASLNTSRSNTGPRSASTADAASNKVSLSNLKQQLTKNPSSLAKYISISSASNTETGEFIGYQVKPNDADSTLFDELGLMENDIVTMINNIKLDNPNKATQAFQKLVNATELEMTVLRAGSEISLFHNLE